MIVKIKKIMKAIQITHSQELNIIDMEKPQAPGRGEILLKLHYVGFCGSDINTFLGRNTMALNPVIPGHEVGAVIEAVGEDVPNGLKPGMVVTCNPYTNCGKCASCRSGSGASEMFTVRRIVQGEGVERKFPLHSPKIAKIVVTRSSRVKRAKLYYLRQRTGKAVRLEERRNTKKADK